MKKKNASLDRSKLLLKEKNLRCTPARLAVLALFESSDHPMSSQEVVARVSRGTAYQATIYRILKSFTDLGILRTVNLRHEHVDYELALHSDHHHIVCTGCGKLEKFEGCDAESIAKKALKKCPSFKTINEHAIELFGLCVRCA
ncbi:MAG: Fur family transcriptional regulator [Patescibacteria group bacterium]